MKMKNRPSIEVVIQLAQVFTPGHTVIIVLVMTSNFEAVHTCLSIVIWLVVFGSSFAFVVPAVAGHSRHPLTLN